MKKIACFIPSFDVGGVEKSMINLANQLSKYYYVELVVFANKGEFKDLVSKEISVIELGGNRLRYALPKLYKYFLRTKCQLVISGPTFCNFFAIISIFFCWKKLKLIVTQHNFQDIEMLGWGLKGRIIPNLIRFLYKRANYIVAVSDGIRDDLIQNYGISEEKVIRIYNPVIDDNFFQNASAYESKEIIPAGIDKYILFIGRLEKVKNCQLVINAFSLLFKDPLYCDLSLVIAGNGIEIATLKKQVIEFDIDRKVYFIGTLQNPLPLLKSASLLINSSYSEAMGMVLVEAIALGTPISASATRGAKEVLLGIELADIYEIDDVPGLLGSIKKMLNFDRTKKESDENLFKYHIENITTQYRALIDKLLQ